MPPRSLAPTGRSRRGRITLLIAGVAVIIGARTAASTVIDYQWWKELGQVSTWLNLYLYGVGPLAAATVAAFICLWTAHALGLKFGGTHLREHPMYARLSALALLLIGFVVSSASLDSWTVVRFIGSRGVAVGATVWLDPVFHLPLSFYLFDLPFYSDLRGYLLAVTVVCMLVYWATARFWQLRYRWPELREMRELDASIFRLAGGLESKFLRGGAAIALIGLAARFYLGRFEMVLNEHGFLVGMDYVDDHIGLPMQWLVIAASLAAAGLVWAGRWVLAGSMALTLLVQFAVPRLVSFLYVKPNEISLERPYIESHIHATRAAYGLEKHVRETEFKASPEGRFDARKHQNLLDNVRLWDWRPFHDTVTQIQALRPYYLFADTDVDRYNIDGRYRQVLLAPRELDIRQVSDARTSWINSRFIYTHGYGIVLADVSKIKPDGLPVLLVQNMPPEISTKSLKVDRPEIYYGENVHEPVYVRTKQEEFNYPAGAENVHTVYQGQGGFPISSLALRLAAAVHEGDLNVVLTDYFTPESRMMIHRQIRERLIQLAGFLEWDTDPYLVITEAGRLVWMVDGYTTSAAHPYSREVQVPGLGELNYIRNAVKATVDAYDGSTNLYIFAPDDPLILAYQKLFPALFKTAAEMPADLRAHARYPEILFRVQAEMYRTYHMTDPMVFYNKQDQWDIARRKVAQDGRAESVVPTYVVASLPGEEKPEFLLMIPFTPRSKDNMIGLMAARCDGDKLGEIVVLQLPKQELIFGPRQIEARIDQDQNISKDLTLWNQQGSQVLRGQTLVLPVEDTFLYVQPVYIQATDARMPQLKKIVLAAGNRLVYADSYEQALAELSSGSPAAAAPAPGSPAPAPSASQPNTRDGRLDSIREHLRKYRELTGQGHWAEAGKELEAVEALTK